MERIQEQMEAYWGEKILARRCETLKKIVFASAAGTKDFFCRAFRKERNLDMKLTALRGYALEADEQEVTILADKLLELLTKRTQQAPFKYQEYEVMRSAYLLPYLLKTYSYQCFVELNEQVEKQYQALPECFKNVFTCDENGNRYAVRDTEEAKQSIREFLNNRKTYLDC